LHGLLQVLMPRSPKTLLVIAGVAVGVQLGALAGCDDIPRDPEDTTDLVTGSVLRVGWVAGAEPNEIEHAAVATLAERLRAAIEISEGPVHQLMAELEEGTVHVVGGAVPEKTPFAKDVGLTKRVGTVVLRGEVEPTVMAIRSGENRFLLLVNEAIAGAKK
jgi:hypothetical protein